MSLSRRGAAAFAAALSLSPAVALAQQTRQVAQPSPLAQGLFSTPQSGATRYSTPDGAVRFTFDSSGGSVALVRFEGDPEVHVLRPVAAAGGDELYRTEDGNIILRRSRHGGITVYTRNNRAGAPAAEEARVAPLTPEAVAFAVMQQRLRDLQIRAARSTGQTVTFIAPQQLNGPATGVVLDAAERAADGLADAPLTTVRRVIIIIGPRPDVQMRGDLLTVQVAPQMGFAGRPSSTTIRNVVTGQTQGPEQ